MLCYVMLCFPEVAHPRRLRPPVGLGGGPAARSTVIIYHYLLLIIIIISSSRSSSSSNSSSSRRSSSSSSSSSSSKSVKTRGAPRVCLGDAHEGVQAHPPCYLMQYILVYCMLY